jgi:hypothetical protein
MACQFAASCFSKVRPLVSMARRLRVRGKSIPQEALWQSSPKASALTRRADSEKESVAEEESCEGAKEEKGDRGKKLTSGIECDVLIRAQRTGAFMLLRRLSVTHRESH